MSESYTAEFFDALEAGSLRSARILLADLWAVYQPHSVVDVGCGRGAWLKAALELGAEIILGLDGDYVDRSKLFIQPEVFQASDLSKPLDVPRRFDLAICLEVAEHLPPECAESFVAEITNFSDVVLFSAAVPNQGGTDHINEQWPEYWAMLFKRLGYEVYDLFRDNIWNNPDVEFWYAQNSLLYVRSGSVADVFPPTAITLARPLARLHPLCFLLKSVGYGVHTSVLPHAMMADWWQMAQSYAAQSTETTESLRHMRLNAIKDDDLLGVTRALRAEVAELTRRLRQGV